MAFNVIDVETGLLVRDGRFKDGVVEYDNAAEATAYAKHKTQTEGRKYKIKQVIIDDSWKHREQTKFLNGTYVTVPWSCGNSGGFYYWCAIDESCAWFQLASEPGRTGNISGIQGHALEEYSTFGFGEWALAINAGLYQKYRHHYPHVSMTNRNMLAFTESNEKGAKDIQTQIKPGTYLKKFYGDYLTDVQIADLVRMWQRKYSDVELKFAREPKDIVRVYQRGPNSCMSGEPSIYRGRVKGKAVHPCMAYGLPHSDLTLAYLENKGGISSRVLVWEEQKQYGRIYGDDTLLQRELQELGYKQSDFRGARIAKIKCDQRKGYSNYAEYVLPYVDGWSHVYDTGDANSFFLDNRSRKAKAICAGDTRGTSATEEIPQYTCIECGDEIDPDNRYTVDDADYCECCHDERFTACDMTGRTIRRDEAQEVWYHRGRGQNRYWSCETWGEYAIEYHGAFYCEVMERYYRDDCRAIADTGDTVSLQAIEEGKATAKA